MTAGSGSPTGEPTAGVHDAVRLFSEADMKRSTAILTLLIAVTWTPIAAADSGAAAFSVEEPRIDLGDIKAGTEAVATFTFHNRGEKDVRIIKAKPS
jgi:hypothetical protein